MFNTAVIGAGVMGANHCRTIANSDLFNLAYVVDVNGTRAGQLADTYNTVGTTNFDEVFDCDAVVIATITESHFELARKLLEANIPVLVEKPLTLNLGETRQLCDYANQKQIPLMCGFVERFNPSISAAINLLEEPVVHMTAMRHSPSPGRATTGVIEDLLIHDLDIALKLMTGNQIRTTSASVQPRESNFVEIAEVSITGDTNQIAHLSASRWSQRKIRQWTIATSQRLIEIDLLQQTVVAFENIDQAVGSSGGASYRTRTVIDYPFIARGGEPLGLQLAHFGKLLNGEASIKDELTSIERTHEVLNTILHHD
jgi:predicted dehydrogenase